MIKRLTEFKVRWTKNANQKRCENCYEKKELAECSNKQELCRDCLADIETFKNTRGISEITVLRYDKKAAED